MRFILLASLLVVAPVQAKKKPVKPKKAAASVMIEAKNECAEAITLSLDGHEIKVEAGAAAPAETLPGKQDWAYPAKLGEVDLGILGFEPGVTYEVVVKGCRGGGGDIYTYNKKPRPKKVSPVAAASIRFRAKQNTHLEYSVGDKGRFMPLSIAMTRYRETPPGDLSFTFRLRAAKRGPILKTINQTVSLEAGHRYLIEANIVDNEVFFKREDEGWPRK